MKLDNIVITGGAGFIGSNTAIALQKLGLKVTIIDNFDEQAGANYLNIIDIKDKIVLRELNILSDDISKDLKKADLIINCAAISSHSLSQKYPKENLQINTNAVLNILDFLRQHNKKCKFIQIGTTTQYGPLLSEPADENHREMPLDIYSANKSLAEKFCLIYQNSYDIDVICLRLSNTYGPRARIDSNLFTFNNYFIGLGLRKESIKVFGSGEQLRNSIYVEDIVDAIIELIQTEKAYGNIFNVVGDDHHSIYNIAQLTASIFNSNYELCEWPLAAKKTDVGNAVFSNKKLRSFISWKATTSLSDGLEKSKEFFDAHLSNYIF